MRSLVLTYYFLLRQALRDRADLRSCLTRCQHCRIIFLTDRRNGHRKDLRCPFGCRAAHRKKRSAKRSAAYYRTASGKKKKARLNRRRRREQCDHAGAAEKTAVFDSGEVKRGLLDIASSDPPQSECEPASIKDSGIEVPGMEMTGVHPSDIARASIEVTEGVEHTEFEAEFDAEIVEHVRLVVGLIDRRDVTREEILTMLARAVRQHRMGREKRLDYVLAWLEKHPP